MTIFNRGALAALALIASMTVAQAQSTQNHEAHHPSDQGTTQAQPTAPPPAAGTATETPPGIRPPGGMIDHPQPGMMGGQGMMQDCPAMKGTSSSPVMQSMQHMHQSMMGTALTGDPDHDFAAMMVPHHQGAIDMARVELRDGKNPEMRKLAERIIKSQEKEIKEMNGWLAKTSAK